MDQLEKFVQENRQSFDDKTPKDFIWVAIEERLNEKDNVSTANTKVVSLRIRIYRYSKIAAVALLLLSIGGFIGSYWTANSKADQLSFGGISEEYQELEGFYTQQVNLKMTRLKKYHYDKALMKDITELDAAFNELQAELQKQGDDTSNEVIIDALIENYEAKIEILERVLERLDRQNTEKQSIKNNKDEKVSL